MRVYQNIEGEEVPSVTTVLQLIQKPELLYWANSLGFRRQSYERVREEAAWIGTLTHAAIEATIEQQLLVYPTTQATIEVVDRMFQWNQWYQKMDIDIHETEKTLIGNRYGGTIDCIASINGIPTIIDWKTSKRFYPEMFLQLSAYVYLLDSLTDYCIQEAMIVLVHPDKIQTKSIGRSQIDALYPIFISYLDAWNAKQSLLGILEEGE